MDFRLLLVRFELGSGWNKAWRRAQRAPVQVANEGLAEDPVPALFGRQLLRSERKRGKEGANPRQGGLSLSSRAVGTGDDQGRLTGMAGSPRHAMQQEGSAGNGFHTTVGIGQATEQAPPVVNQSDTARHHPAPLQVVGGEATPTPLVLDLVEPIFGVRAITIKLRHA